MKSITVTALDGQKVVLQQNEIGTIIGEDSRDREDFLDEGAGAGIYLLRNWNETGVLLQVKETPSEVSDACNALEPVSLGEIIDESLGPWPPKGN